MKTWFKFAFLNFTAPVSFYVVFLKYGAKPAIGVAIAFSIIQLWAHRYYREKISPFFVVATLFVFVLGIADLMIRDPRYFRLEGFATNFVIAVAFFGSAFMKRPLLQLFADALPASVRPAPGEISGNYALVWTLIWATYLLLKSFAFLYLAFRVNLGNLIVLRALIGGASGLVLLLSEYLYRKYRRGSISEEGRLVRR